MVLQRKGIKYIRSWNGEIRSSVGVMNDITKEGDTWAENRRNFMLNQTCVFFKWPIDIWKDVQKPLIIREMQIKTTSHWSESEVKSLSHVRLFATPWTAAYQTPPSMGFSRQEYWSGVSLPSPMSSAGRANFESAYSILVIMNRIGPLAESAFSGFTTLES